MCLILPGLPPDGARIQRKRGAVCMYSSAYVWAKVLSNMEERLGAVTVSAWFDDAEVVELTDDQLILYSSSDFRREIIRRRCTDYVQDALKEIFNSDAKLLVFGDAERDNYLKKEKPATSMDFNPQFTFDNFVVGPSNRFAHSASIAVSKNPGQVYNPLFIYGPSGVGKTHLLYAIANGIRRSNPDANIVYIKGDEFTNELIAAIANGKNIEFRSKYRESDLFLIDDIQFLVGAEKTQQGFFHTFNELHDKNKQIIITSDRSPEDLKLLEERLRSRFTWGLPVDIYPPDYELRCRIIRDKIRYLNLSTMMNDDVINYIANSCDTDVREIEGAINRLQAYTAVYAPSNITLEFAMEALGDYVNNNIYSISNITVVQKAVADYYGITVEALKGKKKSKNIAYPRMLGMYMARIMTNESFPRIGLEFGGRDHSTVIHACDKIEEDLKDNKQLQEIINEIKTKI